MLVLTGRIILILVAFASVFFDVGSVLYKLVCGSIDSFIGLV